MKSWIKKHKSKKLLCHKKSQDPQNSLNPAETRPPSSPRENIETLQSPREQAAGPYLQRELIVKGRRPAPTGSVSHWANSHFYFIEVHYIRQIHFKW